MEFSFSAVNVGWQRVSPQKHPAAHCLSSWQAVFVHIAMITAANTPHTITNALMICFSSETDIAQFSTTPVLGSAGVVTLMRARCVRGGGETHAQSY